MYILLVLEGVYSIKDIKMKDGLTAADIGQVIFLILVVGAGVGGFIYAALKEEK